MSLNNTAKAAALNHLRTLITHVSIHSADPGAAGTANQVGTRQAVTWNNATTGNLDNVGTIQFSVTAGTTVHSVGLWSAASGGTFYGARVLPSPEVFGNNGTFTINDLDVNLND
jgi:hypothetical protein